MTFTLTLNELIEKEVLAVQENREILEYWLTQNAKTKIDAVRKQCMVDNANAQITYHQQLVDRLVELRMRLDAEGKL